MTRREWLSTIAIFILVVVGLVLPAYTLIRVNQVQLNVACLNAQTNVQTLQAIQQNGIVIRRTARSLGLHLSLPRLFEIPEVPPECADF